MLLPPSLFSAGADGAELQAYCGPEAGGLQQWTPEAGAAHQEFVALPFHQKVLSGMCMDHVAGHHICLISENGVPWALSTTIPPHPPPPPRPPLPRTHWIFEAKAPSKPNLLSPNGAGSICNTGRNRVALEGGDLAQGIGSGEAPPPSRAPSPYPVTVPLTASANFDGICNQQ